MSTYQRLNTIITFDNTETTKEEIISKFRKFIDDNLDEYKVINEGSVGGISCIELQVETICSFAYAIKYTCDTFISQMQDSIGALQVRSRSYCLDSFEWDEDNSSSYDYDEDDYLYSS